MRYFAQVFPKHGRIVHLIRRYVSRAMVFPFLDNIRWLYEETAHEEQCQYHPHHAKRISNGTAERRTRIGQSQLLQGILRSGKGRRVGHSPAQHPHHVANGDLHGETKRDGKKRSHYHHAHCKRVKRKPVLAERAEKARPHLQAKGIHKQYKAEILGIQQHTRVNRETQVTGKDAHKKHECHAKRNAKHLYLAKGEPQGAYHRQHHHGLQCRMFKKSVIQPIHTTCVLTKNGAKVRNSFECTSKKAA